MTTALTLAALILTGISTAVTAALAVWELIKHRSDR